MTMRADIFDKPRNDTQRHFRASGNPPFIANDAMTGISLGVRHV